MKDYDLYLFDFDNTLFDTSYGIREILRHALPAVGVEYDDSKFPEFSGLSMEQVFDLYVHDESLRKTYEDEFIRVVLTDVYLNAKPFPETGDVLRELNRRGKHIGIVSGKQPFKIVRLMTDAGLMDLAETVVGYGDTERLKPFPEPILLGMSRFDVPPERTVYVGDSPNDAGAAANAGVDCIIVNRRNGLSTDGIDCTFEVGSLTEILGC